MSRRASKRNYVEPSSEEEQLTDSDTDPTWGPGEKTEEEDTVYVPQKTAKRGRPSKYTKTSVTKTSPVKTPPANIKVEAKESSTSKPVSNTTAVKPAVSSSVTTAKPTTTTTTTTSSKDPEASKFRRGDFIVKVKELPLGKDSAIWKVDSGYLLQKYEFVADNKTSRLLFQSCLTFSSCLDTSTFTLVDTKVTNRNRNVITVEVLKVHEEVEEPTSTTSDGSDSSKTNNVQVKKEKVSPAKGSPPSSCTKTVKTATSSSEKSISAAPAAKPGPKSKRKDTSSEDKKKTKNSEKDSDEDEESKATFHIYIQILLSQALEPEFMTALKTSDEDGAYYLKPLEAIDQMILDKKKKIELSIGSRFMSSLERRPNVKVINPRGMQYSQGMADSVVKSIQLFGEPYDPERLTKIKEEDGNNTEEFMIVGEPAAERVKRYHQLHHFKHNLYLSCVNKIEMQKKAGESGLDVLEQCLLDKKWLNDEYCTFQKLF